MTTVLMTDKSSLVVHDLDDSIIELLSDCVKEVDQQLDHRPEIKVFNKICHQQRSVGFYSKVSEGYKYSNSVMRSKGIPPNLEKLLERVNNKFNASFNGILVNKYENGEDYISKHSDDEKSLDPSIGVVMLSFGALRKFRIRNKSTGKKEIDIQTSHDTIIQMAGEFQKEFTHEVPIERKVKDARYSFTFRRHL